MSVTQFDDIRKESEKSLEIGIKKCTPFLTK